MSGPIIITVPGKYLKLDTDDGASAEAPAPSRKRRLDHLSWEEKMQRKKLKNRVAAQTSRDRKKARMEDMEGRIDQLEAKNEQLLGDMASLKALNERLISENEQLRKEVAAARGVGRGGATGPAESYPQQQEAPPLPASRAAKLILTMCLLSQMSSHTSTRTSISTPYSSSLRASSDKLMQRMKERARIPSSLTLDTILKEAKWWGPHQSSWNPVGVSS